MAPMRRVPCASGAGVHLGLQGLRLPRALTRPHLATSAPALDQLGELLELRLLGAKLHQPEPTSDDLGALEAPIQADSGP